MNTLLITGVQHIEKTHIEKIPVPILTKETEQIALNRLALEASELRYQAYLPEQEAMHIMDDEVLYATLTPMEIGYNSLPLQASLSVADS